MNSTSVAVYQVRERWAPIVRQHDTGGAVREPKLGTAAFVAAEKAQLQRGRREPASSSAQARSGSRQCVYLVALLRLNACPIEGEQLQDRFSPRRASVGAAELPSNA